MPNLDAMAKGEHSIVFWRFYAGSGVCSPTRSAAMTGRSPERDCIDGPEPHGYGPAEKCSSSMPLPPPTFTIAEAARKAGYSTIHIGECIADVENSLILAARRQVAPWRNVSEDVQ